MCIKFYVIDNIRFFTLTSTSLVSDGMPVGYNTLEEVINRFEQIGVKLNRHNRSLIRLWTDAQLLDWWKLRADYLDKYESMLEAAASKDKNRSYRYVFQGKWLIEQRFKPNEIIPSDFHAIVRERGYTLVPGDREDGRSILKLKRAIGRYMMFGL